jgi:hypothetical protein
VPPPVLEVLFVGTAVLLSVELRLHEGAPRRVVHRQRLVVHPAALEHVARRHPGAARGVSLLPYAGACCRAASRVRAGGPACPCSPWLRVPAAASTRRGGGTASAAAVAAWAAPSFGAAEWVKEE